MGGGGRNDGREGGPTRVLVALGSESGSTAAAMRKIIKDWDLAEPKLNYTIVDVLQGNGVLRGNTYVEQAKELSALPSKYDVLLVCTSSYGCGEPPENLHKLFLALSKGAKGDAAMLGGMQHAVLGYGSSSYDTFQNCPRLIDKYLGECGSRRMAMRAELDECSDDLKRESEQDGYLRWTKQVFELLQALPSAAVPPACRWDEPQGKVDLTQLDVEGGGGDGLRLTLMLGVGIAASVAAFWALNSSDTL